MIGKVIVEVEVKVVKKFVMVSVTGALCVNGVYKAKFV